MSDNDFPRHVAKQERRKLRAEKQGGTSVFFGLGLFGVVGWSIALPTVLGALVGAWIDVSSPGQYSWTLMLTVIGLVFGCAAAWLWVGRERKAILKDRDDD